jgi:hypothetical protein
LNDGRIRNRTNNDGSGSTTLLDTITFYPHNKKTAGIKHQWSGFVLKKIKRLNEKKKTVRISCSDELEVLEVFIEMSDKKMKFFLPALKFFV